MRFERNDEQRLQNLCRTFFVGHDHDPIIHGDKFGVPNANTATVRQTEIDGPERLLMQRVSDRLEVHVCRYVKEPPGPRWLTRGRL
jgi:hypothetical protein